MTSLLEIRETIKRFYSRNSMFILPVVKFLVALIVIGTLNSRLGYFGKIDNVAILLIVSLACSFLPSGCILAFAALFSLLHMYALSLEVLVVGFCLFTVLLLLFIRFAPKDSLVIALLPVLFVWKIPYVVPIVLGLVGSPMSTVSVGCGVVVYYILLAITGSAPTISTMGKDPTGKIKLILDNLIGNHALVVVAAAFVATVLVVYFIRRLSIDYSWSIAMAAGAILNMIILFIGDLIYDTGISVVGIILGTVLAVAVGKCVEFFRFCVDYGRAEKVQFEDDEYYYYVKAIPKMTVAETEKTVKRINSQRNVVTERTSARMHSDYQEATAGSVTFSSDEYQDYDEEAQDEFYEDEFDDLV